jgi:nicotinic acid mononucleotide adenylyltransferase
MHLSKQPIKTANQIQNNRLFVKRGMSIKYLLPNPVIDYIHAYGLYLPRPSIEEPIQRK